MNDENGTLRINGHNYRILFSRQEILERVAELAALIKADYRPADTPPILMIVLTGGLYLGVDLSQALARIGFQHHVDTVGLKRYLGDEIGGEVKFLSYPHADLGGRDLIIVEDVVDEGCTMNFLDTYLKNLASPPLSISYCALCLKETHGPLDFLIKYLGYTIGEEWIVGYGLDSDQGYRGLTDIYIKI